jgi:hypothetical protein
VNKESLLSAFLSMLLLSMLLTFCSGVPARAALSWTVQVVDANANSIGNGYCPIAVDPNNNNPHIAYTGVYNAQTGQRAGYASWNGSGWNTQERPGGFVTDLALDANGNPHILIEGGILGPLLYARWTGVAWDAQTITSGHNVVYASLALDLAGYPHAAYTYGEGLKYASWTGSSWNIQTVDPSPEIHYDKLSLALDSDNTPYIMYFNQSTYRDRVRVYGLVSVKLAVLKDSGWSIEPVLASYNLSDCWNMVLDSKGYPHFLCTLPQPPTYLSTILYVSWNGSAWNAQTVVSDASVSSPGFLALDSHDNPSVAYITSNVEVMYANWTGTAWDINSVDTPDTLHDTLGPCYLALDANGIPNISYCGYLSDQIPYPGSTSTLLYATATEVTEPTTPPTFPVLPVILVSTIAIIGAVVIAVYVWKKKTKH